PHRDLPGREARRGERLRRHREARPPHAGRPVRNARQGEARERAGDRRSGLPESGSVKHLAPFAVAVPAPRPGEGRDRSRSGCNLRPARRRGPVSLFLPILLACTACGRGAPPPEKSAPAAPAKAAAVPPRAEPTAEERAIEKTAREAIAWLVQNQNKEGSWGSHESPRPIEVLADVPGSHQAFQYATTALAALALEGCPIASEEKDRAVDRAIDWMLEHFDVKRPNGMEHYNVWSFGYGLQCFGEHLLAKPEDPRSEKIRAAAKRLVEKLAMYQTLDGGWGNPSRNGLPPF